MASSDGKRGVFLQYHQDLAVDGVEAAVGLENVNSEIGHGKLCSIYEVIIPDI